MTHAANLERGRLAYEHQAWTAAFDALTAASEEAPLGLDDLERQAWAAALTGRTEVEQLLPFAHREALRLGDVARAARYAFWLGFGLLSRGEVARGSGWIARSSGLLEEHGMDCVERGYVLLPTALRTLDDGDAENALALFERIGDIAARFDDLDLATLARLGRGTARIGLGQRTRGVALLDEAMVAVTTGEVSPMVTGIVYCATIERCQDLLDLRRAQEWTAALSGWVEAQPDLMVFRGRCQLYRAELLQLHGAWDDAIQEAARAYRRLSTPPPEDAVGEARYRQAELHRLRGELDAAERAYREAGELGRPPEPGIALLRLTRGDVEGALGIVRRALTETQDPSKRLRLLEPAVEILLAGGDRDGARAAADELEGRAAELATPLARALAARAAGRILLAEGDAGAAIVPLRRAWSTWHELEAPYEAAHTRLLIGDACRALGDETTAGLELEAAQSAFARLGAARDSEAVDALLRASRPPEDGRNPAGLSAREVEVLRLLAAGKTNRTIAEDLGISDKTVARHVSNIFDKLGLSSRSAAVAYAYEHGLVTPSTPT